MIQAGASPYEVAVEFIRVGNVMRVLNAVGREPTTTMLAEAMDCRDYLDQTLPARRTFTRTEWDARVRNRLLGNE